jgi:ATP adenylyltransferase
MTFKQLVEFLEHQMQMSHVYQPLLIRALVDAGGTATVRQLAQVFATQDESQLQFYEQRIKVMPLKVLAKHGIVHRDGELVRLTVPRLDYVQRATLRRLCEERLQRFCEDRGIEFWRLLDLDPVPDSLRYQVLKEGGGRCALCGATKDDRPLDVDHILPRVRGGTNDRSNLQVLCAKCNRSKRDRDTTDFRATPAERDASCPLCQPIESPKIVEEHGTVIAMAARDARALGHHLIFPRRHVRDYLTMSEDERTQAHDVLRCLSRRLQSEDAAIRCFDIRRRPSSRRKLRPIMRQSTRFLAAPATAPT